MGFRDSGLRLYQPKRQLNVFTWYSRRAHANFFLKGGGGGGEGVFIIMWKIIYLLAERVT